MNPKQRRNVIILVVLGIATLGVLYWQFFTESEFDRQYRENQEKAAAQPAATPGAPAAPAGAPAATPAATPAAATPAAGAPAQGSAFQRADVDIDELIAGIKEVDFDYDEVAADVNPMTPLVGPFAPQQIAQGESAGGAETMAQRQDIQKLVRNLTVTGIMWDQFDPMAVVRFPVQGEVISEVVTRGFEFPELGVTVHDIETDRVTLNVDGMLIPIELEER
ncbi:MAG: hypothetical protein AMXMBFR82_45720 [Candidatus Hydrogenedentota bacterium]